MLRMTIIQKLWTLAGLPCRECAGKGYVVDAEVAAFIERNGLALYQASEALKSNEITYGGLGSIPIGAWEDVGLSEDQAEEFATEVSNVHVFHSCPSCKGQENHPSPLKAANSVIRSLQADDRRRHAEWKAGLTPEQFKDRLKNRMRWRMDVAIRYAQQPPSGFSSFENETAE